MKKVICFSLLTAWVLLANMHTVKAQCSEWGNSYTCFAASTDINTNNGYYYDWVAGSSLYYMSVSMMAYDENDPRWNPLLGVEIFTDDFYYTNSITGGSFDDYFPATAVPGTKFQLSAFARCGESYVRADW